MFPTPIQKGPAPVRTAYKIALPIALIIWLLPLIAVMITSIRSAGDITAGNYWGWPRDFHLLENYSAVFNNSPLGQYMLNSFKVDDPDRDRRGRAVVPDRLRPGGLPIQAEPAGVLHVRRRQFRAVPDPDGCRSAN